MNVQVIADGEVRYRATFPILVLAFRDNHHAAEPIPAGDVFAAVCPAEDDRFMVVRTKGEEFLVFDGDLNHCERLGDVSFP